MNILAIDCCLRLTGVALMIDDVVVDVVQEDLGRRQSGELPLMTERLLRTNNISWNDINYIALTNGPGYFTGIRVGAAYATGLAYAVNCGVITVSTLDMLLYGMAGKILVLVYAGHGYVYACCRNFLVSGEYTHEQIKSWLENNPDTKIISDDPERTGLSSEIAIMPVKPDVKNLCVMARENINAAINPLKLKILYYRVPQGVS